MNLYFSPTAQKQLKRLPKDEAKKVFKKTQTLKEFPFAGKALSGEFGGSRSLRAWPYRIVYSIRPNVGIVVQNIKHRQGAYKN